MTNGFLLGVVILMWGMLLTLAWKVRTMPTIPHDLTVTASLSAGGVMGYTLLAAALALGPGYPGLALAILSTVSTGGVTSIAYVMLSRPRGWTPPDHGHPTRAAETVAAPHQAEAGDPGRYRAVSAAEAIARAQGAGAPPVAPRSARVRRIMDMEVSQ